jgi:hypothetical protein
MEKDNVVRKPLEKRPLERPMHRLNDNIKWDVVDNVN